MRAFTKITAATLLAGGMSVSGAGAAYAAPQELDVPSMHENLLSQEMVEQFLGSQGEGAEDPEAEGQEEAPAEDEEPAEDQMPEAGNPLEQLPITQEETPAEETPAEETADAQTKL